MTATQKETVLHHLRAGKRLTQLEATKLYGIIRLAPVIHQLRGEGHNIPKEDKLAKKSGNYYAEYYYVPPGEDPNEPSLFGDQNSAGDATSDKLKEYDTLDRSETALRQGSPPEVAGTEIRSHHVSNPDDRHQILLTFRSYCAEYNGKKVPITADWSRQLIKLNRDLEQTSKKDLKRNRPIRNVKLEKYKDFFRNGTFLYTNVGIGFDEDGWLTDGQTRLTASLETGITFYADVSFDLDTEAFYRVDSQGSARTNADFAYMSGITESHYTTVAAVSVLYRKAHGLRHTVRLEPEEVIKALREYPDIAASVRIGKKFKSVVKAPHGIAAAVHYLASKINKDVADKAFADLLRGSDLSATDPVFVARIRLQAAYGAKKEFRGADDRKARVLLSRMFNYRLHGIKVSKYLLEGGDDWPTGLVQEGPQGEQQAKRKPKAKN